MTQQRSFVRKIVYLGVMAVLLLVLAWLGRPATIGVGNEKGSEGGWLARLRAEHGFSEADLGDIDPASETMRLATLGLRGVAVNLLWEKSNTYKMKKDWAHLAATLEQITHLEPHFTKVWTFQAWNLSYNVSAEFDDYRERYRWVIKGIEFLKRGILHNRTDALMYKDVGWFISQKIGRADEWAQFRKLFKADDDFHREDEFFSARPPEDRDNWLVGKAWYRLAEIFVERVGEEHPERAIKKTTPVVFWAYWPMCQMNYCESLAKDGVFDEKARLAWEQATKDWLTFGARQLPSVPLPGRPEVMLVRMNDKAVLEKEALSAIAQLEQLKPGLREKIRKDRYAALTPAERKVYETPNDKRTTKDWEQISSIEYKLRVDHETVAFQITGDNHAKAVKLAKAALDAQMRVAEIESQRNIVNFAYWQRRADVEQTRDALDARRYLYDAQKASDDQDLGRAGELYAKAFEKWRVVLDNPKWPDLKDQEQFGGELVDFIRDYRKVLEKQIPPPPFPKNFILQDILTRHEARTPVRD
jgi:hypothetical protein